MHSETAVGLAAQRAEQHSQRGGASLSATALYTKRSRMLSEWYSIVDQEMLACGTDAQRLRSADFHAISMPLFFRVF